MRLSGIYIPNLAGLLLLIPATHPSSIQGNRYYYFHLYESYNEENWFRLFCPKQRDEATRAKRLLGMVFVVVGRIDGAEASQVDLGGDEVREKGLRQLEEAWSGAVRLVDWGSDEKAAAHQ